MKKIKYKNTTIEGGINGKSRNQAVIVNDEKLTTREIALELEKVTGIPAIRTMSMLTGISEIIATKLSEGCNIKIDGLGYFRSALAVENEVPVIKKVLFTLATETKNVLQKAEFQEVEK